MLSFEDYTWPMKNQKHRPFDHQVETVTFRLNNPRSYDLSDMGTGKTMSALWAADFLYCNAKIKSVLVVSPLSTIFSVWAKSIFDNFPHRSYRIVHGNQLYKKQMLSSPCSFHLINHDGVNFCEDFIMNILKPDLVIIDEQTAFKNWKSDRTKAMKRIADKAKGVWGLTADPIPNSPVEAFAQAKIINPKNTYLPQWLGQWRDLVEVQVAPYVVIPKDDAAKHVNRILQPSIRFERDKCLDIPECMIETREIPFTAEQRRVYDEIKKNLISEVASGNVTAVNAGVKFSKLLQVAAGSVKDENGIVNHLDASTRDAELAQIFEDTGRTKLVVFCAFKASIEHVYDMFAKDKVRVAVIDGDVPMKRRGDLIEDFQTGNLQVLVIQPQAAAHGITLTAANVIVWHSLIPSGEFYNQANGRITRAGQTRKQFIIHLIGSKVEQRILEILEGKMDMSQQLLDLASNL